jgi:pimeloyl-ACP methyl ester carboxylesterase
MSLQRLLLLLALILLSTDSFVNPRACSIWRASSKLSQVCLFQKGIGDVSEDIPLSQDIQFASPLLEEGYLPVVETLEHGTLQEKPLLLYLPGFDGTWMAPFLQLPELSTTFEVRCLTVTMQDRSTYAQLKENVMEFIANQVREPETVIIAPEETPQQGGGGGGTNFFTNLFPKSKPEPAVKQSRAVYLAGESFGGILASDVALSLLKDTTVNLQGLVLINAATCFDRSKLASLGPNVAELPTFLYPFGLVGLLPLFTDEYSFAQLLLILSSKALPSVIDTEAREAYMGRVAFSLPWKLKYMPQETLRWRLQEWLETGCAKMATKLDTFSDFPSFRTLIVAGEQDLCLPSIDEAERLSNLLPPNNHIHVVEGAGHASTCGSRVDLAALMRMQFPELRGRNAMKLEAAAGQGVMLGLAQRYNGEEVGLSPLRYWSKKLYRKPRLDTIM